MRETTSGEDNLAEWEGLYRELFDDSKDLEEVVFVALGAASACWTNLRGAGTFESSRAGLLGKMLLAELERRGSHDGAVSEQAGAGEG